ncbi:MAG: HlyD family type I secretion periplasmic adaptor subunit [Alphaproteobacteria bacterium]
MMQPADIDFLPPRAAAARRRGRLGLHLLVLAISALVLIVGVWAALATIEEVTRGEGRVIPSRQVQLIQNLEGGILAELLVHEGEIVDSGQTLLRISDVTASSNLAESQTRARTLEVETTRLAAETEGREPEFDAALKAEAPALVANELALYASRKAKLEGELSVLRQQREQRRQELAELTGRRDQMRESLRLADEELRLTEPMAEQGVVPRVEFLRLQRNVSELRGQFDATVAAIRRAEAGISEIVQRVAAAESSFRNEVRIELNRKLAELSALRETMTGERDRVRRSDVRSPVRGIVKTIHVQTIGGVVRPAQDIVEIVPLDDTLLIEARVKPTDIAFIRPRQKATVKISAYDYTVYGGLTGQVEDISADSLVDQQTGHSYYRVRVRTDSDQLGDGKEDLPIIPGMTATVDILTGEKTVLSYLARPVLHLRDNALRER